MKSERSGECRICGEYGQLTFEHVPPRRAFNSQAVKLIGFRESLDLRPGDAPPRGKIQQKGAGGYTLCGKCNNDTGAWYGGAFVNWCYQAAEYLIKSDFRPTLAYPYYIWPLRVIKQIVTMFFSVNSEEFGEIHPELVPFVLNKERRYLPPEYALYVYYNVEGGIRAHGISVTANILAGKMYTFSEISFPPFGYVLSIDSLPPNENLLDVSHFSRFSYDDFRMMQLQPPTLPTHLALPGDYRSLDEINEQVKRSSGLGSKNDKSSDLLS